MKRKLSSEICVVFALIGLVIFTATVTIIGITSSMSVSYTSQRRYATYQEQSTFPPRTMIIEDIDSENYLNTPLTTALIQNNLSLDNHFEDNHSRIF